MENQQRVRQLPREWVKLNLGCNRYTLQDWINVDIHAFEGVDVVADLERPWIWRDDSVHYIRAFDIVEHLHDPIHTMNEAWRVLGHGGVFEIWVPSTDGRGAFQDPTHVSFWNRNSFLYYSQKHHARFYPHRILCDYDVIIHDTQPNAAGIIWTWALCRAIKNPSHDYLVSDDWIRVLSDMDPHKRVMAGYEGNGMGTVPY
ncbi:MAG TPA: hypothetical protein ENJ22_00155 [Gammaproteobacteria bacterium]|nr:hypothetical protein [Gammaproteobacteria bacterium]